MPTTGKFNAKLLKLFVSTNLVTPAYTAVGCETSNTFSVNGDTIDASCKDTGGWGDFILGEKSWEMSLDALTLFDATLGATQILGYIANDTEILVKITTDVTGDPVWSGNAIVSTFEHTGDNNGIANYSATFTGKGAPTIGTVA